MDKERMKYFIDHQSEWAVLYKQQKKKEYEDKKILFNLKYNKKPVERVEKPKKAYYIL